MSAQPVAPEWPTRRIRPLIYGAGLFLMGLAVGGFPVHLGVIEIRDAVIGEPFGPMLVFTNKNRTAVAAMIDGRAVELTLEPAKLHWLETVCADLANK